MKKYLLPISILLGALIFGVFYYASQVRKQNAMQQEIKAREFTQQSDSDIDLEYLKIKQDECEALSAGVMKKWNNVMGLTYSDSLGECVVTYENPKTGKVETSPLSAMVTMGDIEYYEQ